MQLCLIDNPGCRLFTDWVHLPVWIQNCTVSGVSKTHSIPVLVLFWGYGQISPETEIQRDRFIFCPLLKFLPHLTACLDVSRSCMTKIDNFPMHDVVWSFYAVI